MNSSTRPNLERVQSKTMNVAYLLGLLVLAGTGIWLLSKVTMAASLLAVSILVAYLISPLVDFFCRPIVLRLPWRLEFQFFGPRRLVLPPGLPPRRLTLLPRGMPRVLAISVVYVILGLVLAFVMAWLVPVVHKEFQALVGNLGPLLANLENLIHDVLLRLEHHFPRPLPPWLDPEHFRRPSWPSSCRGWRGRPNRGHGPLHRLHDRPGPAAAFLLVPLLTFYILMDSGRYRSGFLRLIPPQRRAEAQVLLGRIDGTLGRYIRGQLIVILSVSITITVALEVLGVEYALLIGIFAGVTEVIPYAGVAMGLVPAFLIALLKGGLWFAILVVVVLEIIHWLQGHIVVPAVMGHSVNLPPLTVMMALIAGFELGGIMGMVVAIPMAGIARVVVLHRLEMRDAQAAEVKALSEEPGTAAVPSPPAG